MAMTASELTLKINSTGIDKATADLKELAKAAASVDSETKAFVVSQAQLQAQQAKTSKTTKEASLELINQKRDYQTWAMAGSQMFLQQKRDVELWKMGVTKAAEEAAAALKKYNETQKSYANLWKEMDTKKGLEQAQQYKLYTIEVAKAAAATREAEKITKAHGDALEMNKKFDAERAKQLARSTAEQEKHNKSLEDGSRKSNAYINTLRSMAAAASAYIGVNFAKSIFEQADAWSMMQSKLNLAVGSMDVAKNVQQDLFNISQKLRVPVEDTGKLFTRMSVPLQKMGLGVKDTEQVVGAFSTALKLAGATGQEASSAMLQFSQSINAGRLNGGEFNSIAEASPNILRAIEAELIRTGKGAELASKGLKKMASDGKLTTDVLVAALKNAAPQWEKDFESLPLTVDGALTRIKNAWFKAIGEIGQDTKFNEELAKSLKTIEGLLPAIARGIATAFTFVVNNSDKILALFTGMTGAFAVFKTISFVEEMSKAYVAVDTLTKAAGGLRAALAVIGFTPVGAALAALGVVLGGGVYLWNKYNDEVKKAAERKEAVSKVIPDIIRNIDNETKAIEVQIAKLNEELGIREKLNTQKGIDGISDMSKAMTSLTELELKYMKSKQAWDKVKNEKLLSDSGLFREMKDDEEKLFAARKSFNELSTKQAELATKQQTLLEKQRQKDLGERVNSIYSAARTERQILDEQYAEKIKKSKESAEKLGMNEFYLQQDLLNHKKWYRSELEKIQDKPKKAKESDLFDGQVELYKETMELRAKAANKEAEEFKKRTDGMYEQNVAMASQLEILTRQLETEESLKQSKAEQNVLEAERALSLLNASGVMGVEIALANERVRLAKELAAVTGKIDSQKDLQKSKDFLDKMFDDAKVDNWSNSVSKGLSGIVKSFTDLSKAMDKFSSKQALIKKGREEYSKIAKSGTESEIELANRKAQLDEKESEYKIASYAEMADAAKGFFAEGTRGYQTLDGVSKIFHAAQMARNLIEMGQLAIKAVMNQANGDPYTAWARMGAMAAVVAGLGFAVGGGFSGGKGGEKAEDVQKAQGTGTVFGDSSAKSDSLTKALDSMRKNFDKLYPVNVGMLNALKNIEKSMTGLTNIVFRTGITTDTMGIQQGTLSQGSKLTNSLSNIPLPVTALLGGWIGLLGSKIAGLIGNLWGKTTQNIVDSGLSLGGSLSGLKQGQGINQYASVDVTKSSWFGLKKTTTNQVQQQAVSNDISSQIGMIFSNMQTALEEAGKALFGKSDDVTKALEALTLSTTKISLKGLSGQALSDALNAVISKGLDEMAGSAFKDFAKYQQVGEGMAATVLRVADNFATVNSIMSKMNLTLFEMSMSGIDASLKLSDLMGGLEELKSAASSYYENFFTEEERNAKTLEALKEQFKGMNQELPTSIKGYRELLESLSKAGDTEKVATMLKLSDAFAALYKSSSESLDPLTAAKDAFDKLSKDAERWLNIRNQATALKDSLDTAMGNAKKDPALRIKKLWDAMSSDISPEQKLTLANELKDLILDKYQVEKEGIQKLIDFGKQLRGYTDSLKLGNLSPLTTTQKLAEAQKQFQETLNKAMGGDTTAQSALTGKADAYLQLAQTAYASSGAYTSIFESVTGALDALGLSSMSAEDKNVALQQSQYDELAKLRDYAAKMETLSDSYYKTNLSLLAEQTTALSKLYDKMGVFDGIATNLASLPAEIAANLSEIMKGNSSGNFITSLYNSVAGKSGDMIDKQGFDYWTNELNLYGKEWVTRSFQESVKVVTGGGIAALPRNDNTEVVTQLAAVKEELAAMRVEAQKQTGDLITATYDANSANAVTVVEGTAQSLQETVWATSTTPTLI